MNYSEFFQKFYISRSEGGLIGYKAQKKIPEFFFKFGLDENYWEMLPTSESAYEKYFKSGRNPKSDIWVALNNHFDADSLLKKLLLELNESKLKELMFRFGITLEVTEVPDKRQFANALVVQFETLAAGNGSGDNIVPAEYKKVPEPVGFDIYLRSAKNKLKWMKLPGEGEHLISELFVANNIGTSSAVFPHRIRGNYIKDATLTKIRTFDRRGEIRRAFLIGACGYGKTLMMQHLFLEAADHRNETGLLPVFAKLRDFSPEYDDFVVFLVDAVQEFDLTFTYEMAVDLLEKGSMQILLDGLDEMDPAETKHFQKKLAELWQHYPDNQIVISSRQCSALKGISRFTPLYIHPLDDDQSQALIDKLLQGNEDKTAKETVMSFIGTNTGYVRRNGFIATNPMLLTIIVRHYQELSDQNGNKMRFYELLYNALIKEHDEDKESFERFFHSVGNSDEFTEVFREFCALAYMEGVFEFGHRSFERFFRQLKKDKLQNQSIFSLTNFQHDVCATACMMYEQESGIYYIDPGFQDYFFAEYYYQEDTEPTKKMGRALWDRKINSFRNMDALKMLYEIADEKTEVCIFLPYLDSIFRRKSEEEAFLRYLSYGYGHITYLLFDEPKLKEFIRKEKTVRDFDYAPPGLLGNAPQNIIMGLIQDLLGVPNSFLIGSYDQKVNAEGATHFITGFYEIDRNEEDWYKNGPKSIKGLRFEIQHLHDHQYLQELEFTPFPITDDETGCAVVFGYEYKIDPLSLLDKPEKMNDFLELCNRPEVREAYEAVKTFYKEISEKQKVNEYR